MGERINRFKDKKVVFYLAHSLFYSAVVLFFTALFRFLPTAVNLENGIYDKLQKRFTIDSKSDYFYDKYKPYLDEILLVNIDSSIIDIETDRIKRDKLVEFLKRLEPYKEEVKCVFFDYAFYKKSPHDSMLIAAMQPYGNKIVLPYYFELKDANITLKNPVDDGQIINYMEPIYKDASMGFVKAYAEDITFLNRYVMYHIETDKGRELKYVPWVIAHKFNKDELPRYKKKTFDEMIEIKYILRNNDVPNKERASMVYSINDFINNIPPDALGDMVKNKVVFVGLFEGYKTKYGFEIDKFPTPVKGNLSGPQIIVNAYLNLISGTIVKKGTLLSVFIFNLLVGFLIALYRKFLENVKVEIIWYIIMFLTNLFISFVIFPLVAALFYIYLDTKLLIGISMFIFLQHYPLYIIFKTIYNPKKSLKLREAEE